MDKLRAVNDSAGIDKDSKGLAVASLLSDGPND